MAADSWDRQRQGELLAGRQVAGVGGIDGLDQRGQAVPGRTRGKPATASASAHSWATVSV